MCKESRNFYRNTNGRCTVVSGITNVSTVQVAPRDNRRIYLSFVIANNSQLTLFAGGPTGPDGVYAIQANSSLPLEFYLERHGALVADEWWATYGAAGPASVVVNELLTLSQE